MARRKAWEPARGGSGAAELMRDTWRRWRCQTGAKAASRGEEMAAAMALCKTGELEVGDELEGLVCKKGKVQGPRSKVKFATDLGLK